MTWPSVVTAQLNVHGTLPILLPAVQSHCPDATRTLMQLLFLLLVIKSHTLQRRITLTHQCKLLHPTLTLTSKQQ
jgi:hypothetical protein